MMHLAPDTAKPDQFAMDKEEAPCSMCGQSRFHVIARGRDYIYHGSREYLTHVECDGCGHIFLNPRPTVTALPVMYPPNYGTFSGKLAAGTSLLGRIKARVNLRRFRSALGDVAHGTSVLDVGCGDGSLLLALAAKRPDLKLSGLDWNFPPPRRRILEAAGIRLIEGPVETIELPATSFDVILLNQLVEHLWEPAAVLATLAYSLKLGGRLVVETPNTDGYDRALFVSGAWGGYYVPRHLNLYNHERLRKLIQAAGLSVVRQRNLPAPIVWCYSLKALMEEKFGGAKWALALFDPGNVLLLAALATLDTVAAGFGFKTSNQQASAVKLKK